MSINRILHPFRRIRELEDTADAMADAIRKLEGRLSLAWSMLEKTSRAAGLTLIADTVLAFDDRWDEVPEDRRKMYDEAGEAALAAEADPVQDLRRHLGAVHQQQNHDVYGP